MSKKYLVIEVSDYKGGELSSVKYTDSINDIVEDALESSFEEDMVENFEIFTKRLKKFFKDEYCSLNNIYAGFSGIATYVYDAEKLEPVKIKFSDVDVDALYIKLKSFVEYDDFC